MASTAEGEGWQVQASPMGPAGKRPGWEDERVRVGQDKGPAPHLTAKGAGHHLHDKEKSLSIWAGPKGDLPTAFEVGSRAGRGLGSPRRFPQVRSSAGTGPWGQHDHSVPRARGNHRSQGPLSCRAGHPLARAPAAATATLHAALSPEHTRCPSHTHTMHHSILTAPCTHTQSTLSPPPDTPGGTACTHTRLMVPCTHTQSLQYRTESTSRTHRAWTYTQLLPCTHTQLWAPCTPTTHSLSPSQLTLSCTATAPRSHPCTFETLPSPTSPRVLGVSGSAHPTQWPQAMAPTGKMTFQP